MRTVRDRGLLSSQEYKALVNGETVLDINNADTMIENVIGVMGLPIGLGLNFLMLFQMNNFTLLSENSCHSVYSVPFILGVL